MQTPRFVQEHLPRPAPATLARQLGWFSIALGVAELVAPRAVARVCGMREDSAALIRLCGARELATGIGILRSRNAAPWLWGRVAGDVLDMGMIGALSDKGHAATAAKAGTALLNVAAVTAVDVYTAQSYKQPHREPDRAYDYSQRSGFPQGVAAARGAARDFEAPRDMRTPEALRPWRDGRPAGGGAQLAPGNAVPSRTEPGATVRPVAEADVVK